MRIALSLSKLVFFFYYEELQSSFRTVYSLRILIAEGFLAALTAVRNLV